MNSLNKIPQDFQYQDFNRDERYEKAAKRVKKIKGFYIHLLVYLIVNSILLASNFIKNSDSESFFWSWQTFSTALFWGIGLTSHGISVFGKNLFFSANWEEKKIKEFMEKEKSQKWE